MLYVYIDRYCGFYYCSLSSNKLYLLFFFFKQKTAYEMRISDWSSDVCSSDLFCPGSVRGMKLHFRPVGKPAPPRPRRLDALTSAMTSSGFMPVVSIDRKSVV